MAEILTESFCERCGTRYTFEAAIPKKHRIGRLKVLSKGLKNYVLSEDASLDEALAEARSEEERELSGGQLDAFHQTFQFCMSCRQYTCANCWNEAEGRCLSCAPLSLGGNHLRSPLDDLLAGGGIAPFAPPTPVEDIPTAAAALETNGHVTMAEPAANGSAWPTIDLFRAPDEQAATEMAAPVESPEAVIEAPPSEAPAIEVATVEADAEMQSPAADEAIPAEAAQAEPATDFWTRPFTGFAPQPEATNGHAPVAEPEAAEMPAAELERIAPFESAAEPEPVAALEISVAGEATSEPVPLAEAVAEPATIGEPIAGAPEEASAAAAGPIVDEVPVEAPAPEPIAAAPAAVEAPAPIAADPEAAARAAELAERTTRLLGRFRVQPRSAATTAGEQAAAASAAAEAAAARQAEADATAAREAAAAAAALTPAASAAPISAAPESVPEPALQAWPEPVAWGTWKSEAMIAGTLEPPASAQPPAEPLLEDEPVQPAAAEEPAPAAAPVEAEPAMAAELAVELAPAPAAAAEPAPPAPAVAPATDRIEMPGWPTIHQRHLSDSAPVAPQPGLPSVQGPTQAPQWPAPLRPDLDVSSTPFWASGEASRASGLDVWDASAREVTSAPGIAASPVGVQACVSCGLSLSATARFCRRCGSRQS